MAAKKAEINAHILTPAEQRAARAERIKVSPAQPFGWVAQSESNAEQRGYHLYCEPRTKRLVCTCADFVYRGNAEAGYECKHITAALKFIGRWYLAHEYDPHRPNSSVA